jgi:hypothetical protein
VKFQGISPKRFISKGIEAEDFAPVLDQVPRMGNDRPIKPIERLGLFSLFFCLQGVSSD